MNLSLIMICLQYQPTIENFVILFTHQFQIFKTNSYILHICILLNFNLKCCWLAIAINVEYKCILRQEKIWVAIYLVIHRSVRLFSKRGGDGVEGKGDRYLARYNVHFIRSK